MELNRRKFIIASVGAAICAGLTPTFYPSLLPMNLATSKIAADPFSMAEINRLFGRMDDQIQSEHKKRNLLIQMEKNNKSHDRFDISLINSPKQAIKLFSDFNA